jgi:DnaJ-class molecular chaperone
MNFQPPEEDDPRDDDQRAQEDEEICQHCKGDGRDPYTDYLMPCPVCQGEQTP